MNKDVKQLIKELEAAGLTVKWTKKNHLKISRPGTRETVILAGTPSDSHAIANARAHIKRAFGIDTRRR